MNFISELVKLSLTLISVVNTLGEYHNLKQNYFINDFSHQSSNEKISSSILTSSLKHYDGNEGGSSSGSGGSDTLSSHLIDRQSNQKDITAIIFPRHRKPQSNFYTADSMICGGVSKSYQTILLSPNYPNDYPPGVRCIYTIKSPFLCRNMFHVQFLDFHLESSKNCRKDSLSVGGMDKFCGQVIGINQYNTSDGILYFEFNSDEFAQDKGFKLLITRLPCQQQFQSESESGTELNNNNNSNNNISSTEKNEVIPQINILPPYNKTNKQYLPPAGYLPSIFSYPVSTNFQNAYPTQPCNQIYPIYPFYPEYLIPNITSNDNHPLFPIDETVSWRPSQTIYSDSLPVSEVKPQITPWQNSDTSSCCLTSFKQKRFYLTSFGFLDDSKNHHPKNCLYYIEKSGPNVCRLRIEFKFFFIGSNNQNCEEDFVEIDNQRICGCRTGLIYTSQWGFGAKNIHLKMSGKQYLHHNGFILDIIQEDCPYRYSKSKELPDNHKSHVVHKYEAVLVKDSKTPQAYILEKNNRNEKQTRQVEGPSNQFVFSGSTSCTFTLIDYIRLSLESLWIQKPHCVIP